MNSIFLRSQQQGARVACVNKDAKQGVGNFMPKALLAANHTENHYVERGNYAYPAHADKKALKQQFPVKRLDLQPYHVL
jgi:hypothetical protein